MESTQEMMDRIAKSLAKRYAAKCWYVDKRDLEQTAHQAMLYALPKFDEDKGTQGSEMPLPAWLWFCARNAVAAEVMAQSSPVTSTHRRANAIGTTRASLYMDHHGDGQERERPELAVHSGVDEQYAACERSEYVRQRLTALVGDQGRVFALKYLAHTDSAISAEKVAEKSNVPVSKVYAYSRRLLASLREDSVLQQLWDEA
jgi:DNA-directed RNA polymerase specialized sigma24 family protein